MKRQRRADTRQKDERLEDTMNISPSAPEMNGKDRPLVSTKLTTRHLADLRASGLDDGQIVRCGFYSLKTAAAVGKVLRWKRYNGQLGDCLCIPFFDVDGKPSGYCRLKPDCPRKKNDDGKSIKYESPKGLGNRPTFLRARGPP
jgi:hypothetical protein